MSMRQPAGTAQARETRRLADLANRPSGNPFIAINQPQLIATGYMSGSTWVAFSTFPSMTFPIILATRADVPGVFPIHLVVTP